MAAFVDVVLRPAEAIEQEPTKAILGAGQVVRRIHRSKEIVSWHLGIKRANQTREAIVADASENLVF